MGPLLAPVDLDMAYTRETYFANTTGAPDNGEFDSGLQQERKSMRSNLGGSTDSTGLADMEVRVPVSSVRSRLALRGVCLSLCPPSHAVVPGVITSFFIRVARGFLVTRMCFAGHCVILRSVPLMQVGSPPSLLVFRRPLRLLTHDGAYTCITQHSTSPLSATSLHQLWTLHAMRW